MKINLKLNERLLQSMGRQTLIWGVAFMFWTLLRSYGLKLDVDYPQPTVVQWIRIHIGLALAAGLLFGSLSYVFEHVFYRKLPFGLLALVSSLSYLLAIILIAGVGFRLYIRILSIPGDVDFFKDFLFSKSTFLLIIYCFIVGFFIDIFKEIDKKFGPGNLWKMIKGEFYSPKEDERIFMFLDLKSSTMYAEKLGHIKFSRLIQDCFTDLKVVIPYKAEIYQYVGDEVVLSWPMETGLSNGNCLRAFFAYINYLNEREDHYVREYGFVPEFKAGINLGKITVAEVGDIKREIAFHGDVLNTAARIQEQCVPLGAQLLVSEALVEIMQDRNPYSSKEVGTVLLKGKTSEVRIFSIHEN